MKYFRMYYNLIITYTKKMRTKNEQAWSLMQAGETIKVWKSANINSYKYNITTFLANKPDLNTCYY